MAIMKDLTSISSMKLQNKWGLKSKFQDMGFDVLITALEQGKIDAVIASMSATPEREEQVSFSTPYFFGDQTFLLLLKGHPSQ